MCQTHDGRPFPSNKELLAHVVAAHQRRICTICLQVGACAVALSQLCHNAMQMLAEAC